MTDTKSTWSEFENEFRAIKNELQMRRNQVKKLESDLETVQTANYNLTQALEKLKTTHRENKMMFEMFQNKCQEFEPKYYEKRDALEKLELKFKIEVSTLNKLRDDYQKIKLENSDLKRKVTALEEKATLDRVYINELNNKTTDIANIMETIRRGNEGIQQDKNKLEGLFRDIDLAAETLTKCEQLSIQCDNLKKDKEAFEQKYLKHKAKSATLESYLQSNNTLKQEKSLETKALLMQCKKLNAHYKTQASEVHEVMTSLNNRLTEEQTANFKLVKDKERQCRRIADLQANIDWLKSQLKAGCEKNLKFTPPKKEVIEIADSQ